MKFKSLLGYLFVALLSVTVFTGCGNGGDDTPTPSPTPSPTPTVEPTPTPSPTVEPTPTPSPTPSPTVSPTATPTSTVEPTVTPSPMVEPVSKYTNSIELKSISSKIIGYELLIHCQDLLPSENEIHVDLTEISVYGRIASILGKSIDSSRQNIKIAVVSSGTQSGVNVINKAIEFNGCTNAELISAILVDSSAEKIDNPKIIISQ